MIHRTASGNRIGMFQQIEDHPKHAVQFEHRRFRPTQVLGDIHMVESSLLGPSMHFCPHNNANNTLILILWGMISAIMGSWLK